MITYLICSSVFSPSQIAVCIAISCVLLALIAANVVMFVIFARRGEHRMCNRDLQSEREKLLERLNHVRSGGAVETGSYPLWEIAAKISAGGQVVPPDVAVAAVASVEEEEADESEEVGVDVLAVADMAPNTRALLGFVGEEYDLKRYYVRYSYGFEAKLRSADPETKDFYTAFLNEVASYKGISVSPSYRKLRIYKGRNTLAVMLFRGKKLCVALALDPAQFAETKYHGEDMSEIKRFEKTPMLMRFTSARKLEYTKFLFGLLAETEGVLKGDAVQTEYDLEEQNRDEMFAANIMRIIVLGEAPPLEQTEMEDDDDEEETRAEDEEEFTTTDDVTVAFDSELSAVAEETETAEETEFEDMVSESGSVVRYNRSFAARVIQASQDLKGRYGELKNYLLSYTGISSRESWRRESFSRKRKCVATLCVRGKTLCLNLLLDPTRYDGTKYKVDNLAERSKNAKLPLMYRVKSDRGAKFAKELIDDLMKELGIKRQQNYVPGDFIPAYKKTEVLIRRDLIRVVGEFNSIKQEDEQALRDGIRYDRSFAARVIQSDELLKMRYSDLKNHLLDYGCVCRNTWKRETYKQGKQSVACMCIRGRTLCLYLAANPADYQNTKYRGEAATNKSNEKYPLLYRIKSERKLNYAKQIIDAIMKELGVEKTEREQENYALPYRSTDNLIKRGMIRATYRASFGVTRENGDAANEEMAAKRGDEEQLSLNISVDQISEVAAEVASSDARDDNDK